jgi:hypothetical protein
LIARAASREQHGSAPDSSAFALLAYPFMPAERERRGVAVEAPPDWSFDHTAMDLYADAIVWGRVPEPTAPLVTAAGRAGRRELSLRALARRLPYGWRVAAVHRLPPRELRAGYLRGRVRAALRGGVLVELSPGPRRERVLDAVARAAGVSSSQGSLHAGTGGVLLVPGHLSDCSAAVLRVARAGGVRDPTAAVGTLELLRRESVPFTPRLHAHGCTAGASWLAERALPGRRPRRVTDALTRQVADLCALFPRGDGPPIATADDLGAIARLLPDRAGAVTRLAAEVSHSLQDFPSVMRHGDLWAGNLLADGRGSLSGVVDWDAAHPAAVAGADLLQLVATEARRAARLALGPAFLTRPWRLASFARATSGYWRRVGLHPSEEELDVLGVAWWATEVHGTLARLPQRASDPSWLETNVDPVLHRLGY